MNVPQLRFDGFDGEWETHKLGEITELTDGTHYTPDYKKSGIPFWSVETITVGAKPKFISKEAHLENIKRCKPEYDDILVTRISSGINSLGIPKLVDWNEEFSIYVSVGLIKSSPKFHSEFLSHYISSPFYKTEFRSKSLLTATPKKINMVDFKNTKVILPHLVEQEKVAAFFTLVTKRIEKQHEKIEKLEHFKKGMMQKVFSQELRFKDEDGGEFLEWDEKVKAKDLFASISDKSHGGDLPVLSASQEKGIVMRDSNNIQIQFSVDNLVNYKKVEPNDFVISLRSFQGGIEYSQLLGIMSPAYTIFRAFDKEKIYSPYFSFLFKTTDFITRLNNLTYGIRDGKAISFTDFSTMAFNVPSYQEQKKIADYLSNIDRKIVKEKKKMMVLEEQKRGFMQLMFV